MIMMMKNVDDDSKSSQSPVKNWLQDMKGLTQLYIRGRAGKVFSSFPTKLDKLGGRKYRLKEYT